MFILCTFRLDQSLIMYIIVVFILNKVKKNRPSFSFYRMMDYFFFNLFKNDITLEYTSPISHIYDDLCRRCAGWARSCAASSSWTGARKPSTCTRPTRRRRRRRGWPTSWGWRRPRAPAGPSTSSARAARSMCAPLSTSTTSSLPGKCQCIFSKWVEFQRLILLEIFLSLLTRNLCLVSVSLFNHLLNLFKVWKIKLL